MKWAWQGFYGASAPSRLCTLDSKAVTKELVGQVAQLRDLQELEMTSRHVSSLPTGRCKTGLLVLLALSLRIRQFRLLEQSDLPAGDDTESP